MIIRFKNKKITLTPPHVIMWRYTRIDRSQVEPFVKDEHIGVNKWRSVSREPFIKKKYHILVSHKDLKWKHDVDNDAFYQYTKYQLKIIHIFGLHKRGKIWKIWESRNFTLFTTIEYQSFSPLRSPKVRIRYFLLRLYKQVEFQHCLHSGCFLDFFG